MNAYSGQFYFDLFVSDPVVWKVSPLRFTMNKYLSLHLNFREAVQIL